VYSEKVMELFKNPHNMGKLDDADGIGKVGNIICGDVMYIYIKVAEGMIKDIKFETFGCAAAIATSSMITDLAKGKTLEEALKIGRQDVSNALDSLPPIKEHCSNLAAEALHEAIYDYLKKNNKPIPEQLKKEHDRAEEDLETIKKRHEKS
jgi:nitrogen fixation NifU-like protein